MVYNEKINGGQEDAYTSNGPHGPDGHKVHHVPKMANNCFVHQVHEVH